MIGFNSYQCSLALCGVSRLGELWSGAWVGQLQPTVPTFYVLPQRWEGPTRAHARTEGETTDAIAISLGYATPEAVQFALPCQSRPTSISYLLPLPFTISVLSCFASRGAL